MWRSLAGAGEAGWSCWGIVSAWSNWHRRIASALMHRRWATETDSGDRVAGGRLRRVSLDSSSQVTRCRRDPKAARPHTVSSLTSR